MSDVTRAIRELLEDTFPRLMVRGEVSNLSRPQSGHIYFTLVDDEEGRHDSRLTTSQLPCVIWRSSAAKLRDRLENGQKVIVTGRISVYEPRGTYQLIADRVEPAGLGELQRRFEELKDRLRREGLFDPERKRPLPFLPRRIGLVTSPTGAAVRDVLRALYRRYPPAWVRIVPVRVQGVGAAEEIARAVEILQCGGGQVEVIVLARGGGSLEDLWAFNEEVVARAIAGSAIPVVSAIGHEVDFSISDFVADARAQTPTRAPELLVPEMSDLLDGLGTLRRRLDLASRNAVDRAEGRLQGVLGRRPIRYPLAAIEDIFSRLDGLGDDLGIHLYNRSRRWQDSVTSLAARLEALNPLKVLARGYCLTTDAAGRVVTDASSLRPEDPLHVRLARGAARVKVTSVEG